MLAYTLAPSILQSCIIKLCYNFLCSDKVSVIKRIGIDFIIKVLMRVLLEHFTSLDVQKGWIDLDLEQMDFRQSLLLYFSQLDLHREEFFICHQQGTAITEFVFYFSARIFGKLCTKAGLIFDFWNEVGQSLSLNRYVVLHQQLFDPQILLLRHNYRFEDAKNIQSFDLDHKTA